MPEQRKATYSDKQGLIQLWVSPNSFGTREAKSFDQAERLIQETGIPQQLVEGWIKNP